MENEKYMPPQIRWRWLLPLLLSLLPLFAFPQEGKENHFLNKWAVGAGYNFLHRSSDYPFDKSTFEISIKYRHTPKHSFYLTVPFYFKNNKKEQRDFELIIYNDYWYYRIWGIGAGYDYTFFDWKGLSAFGGIGFDFRRNHRQRIVHHYIYDNQGNFVLDEFGNKCKDHFFRDFHNNLYGLTPQIGLSYRLGHWGCDLKYTFSVFLDVYDDDIIYSDGSSFNEFNHLDSIVRSCRCLHGLSASLFYYF